VLDGESCSVFGREENLKYSFISPFPYNWQGWISIPNTIEKTDGQKKSRVIRNGKTRDFYKKRSIYCGSGGTPGAAGR
jgi:hypothetical protein